jgi:hypothetical protein
MILGMTPFTFFHVLLSLVGIFSGFVVVLGFIGGKRLDRWTAVFLATTVLTSVTGFLFPVHHFMPSHAVGIISLVVLALAVYALYLRRLAGVWRRVFVITATIAQYLNFFVLIVQLFTKVPALKVLAPTQSELTFKVARLTTLVIFVLLTIVASMKFRDDVTRKP